MLHKTRDSSVGIATVYELDGQDSISAGARDFSLLYSVQTGAGHHPTSVTTKGVFRVVRAKWL
jgi:hypothetical protein